MAYCRGECRFPFLNAIDKNARTLSGSERLATRGERSFQFIILFKNISRPGRRLRVTESRFSAKNYNFYLPNFRARRQ